MSPALLVVLLPLIAAFLVLSIRDPIRFALPVYAALIPFGSGLSVGLPSAFGSVSSLLGIVLGVALLMQLLTLRRSSSRIPSDLPVWLGFLGLTGATVFWSVAPQVTATSFAALGSLVLLYVLLVLTGIDRADLARTESALVVGGVLAAGYGLMQLLFLGGLPSGEGGTSPRFGNGLLGPNNQAAALLLPLAIAMARMALQRGHRRLAYAIAATVLLVGVVLTGSRGGLLAAMVTVLAMIIFTRHNRHVLVAYTMSGVLLLGVLFALNPAGVGERQLQSEQTSSGRAEVWAVGLSACRTYCLFGSGWGTFPQVYAAERATVPEARVLRGTAYEAHNIWVLAGVESGVLGFFLVTLGLGLSLRTALRLRLRGPPVAALTGTVFSGIFLSNLEFKFFWMALVYVALCHQCDAAAAREGSDRVLVPLTGR